MKVKDSTPMPSPPRPRRNPSIVARGLLLAGLLASALLAACGGSGPSVTVPTPAKPAELEPQLRTYVEDRVRWVRQAPRDPRRQATLGMVYAANALWAEALEAFRNVIRLSPDEPLAHLYVAVSLQELGEAEVAMEHLRQLTRRFPGFPQGFYRLGEAALRMGALDEAEPAFERLVQLAPQEWRGPAGLGEIALRKGDPGSAARYLERAVGLDAKAQNAHYLLGQAYRGLGRSEEAQLHLSLGLDARQHPMPDAWSTTASQHMRLLPDQIEIAAQLLQGGQAQAAIRLLETALTYQPTNPSLMLVLAHTYTASGSPARAQLLARKVLDADPRNAGACIALSTSLHELGENQPALEWADRAVALASNTAPAHLARANALLGLEQDQAAVSAMASAARCDPKDGALRLEMGDVWLRNLQRPDEALRCYEAAAQLEPALVSAQVRLATLHAESGRTNEARAAIERIRRLDPANPTLPLLEGRLHPPGQSP